MSCQGVRRTKKTGYEKHEIHIPEFGLTVVYCRLVNNGNNWIVVQHRIGLHLGFSKTWDEYKHGFETLQDSFWLGLEILHRLTSSDKKAVLQFGMTSLGSQLTRYVAMYRFVQVAGESDGYRLSIGDFDAVESNVGNAFLTPDAGVFVTKDRDNGKGLSILAQEQGGGWWANGFNVNNLNVPPVINGSYPPTQWRGVNDMIYDIEIKLRY